MTTPPSGDGADAAADSRPEADTAPPSGGAAEQETSTIPPAAPPPPYPPPPPPPWLAPVARPPRVLWINPARRPHVWGSAAVAGLVLLGAGIGIGWATSDDGHDHGRSGMHFQLRPGNFPDGPHQGYFPRQRPGRVVPPSRAPVPTPTSTG